MHQDAGHSLPGGAAETVAEPLPLDLAFLFVMFAGAYLVMATLVYSDQRDRGVTRRVARRRAAWWPAYLLFGPAKD